MTLYEQFARVGKALANPARLELLDLLAQGERSVEDLAEAARMKLSNTSAQLRTLAATGLVEARRDGVKVYYRLADEQVAGFAAQVQDFAAARLAEVERAARDYLGDVTALEPVAQEELARRLRDGDVLVLDVRPEAEYAAGHIPGAVNVPHDQLAARLAALPAELPAELSAELSADPSSDLSGKAEIVAYCRGRYCVFAPYAVRLLREHGFTAHPLEGGLPDWRRAGLPISAGTGA
jgi:rhodanese-related sulfurtransferase